MDEINPLLTHKISHTKQHLLPSISLDTMCLNVHKLQNNTFMTKVKNLISKRALLKLSTKLTICLFSGFFFAFTFERNTFAVESTYTLHLDQIVCIGIWLVLLILPLNSLAWI